VDMRFPAVAGGEGINRSGGTCQRKGWGRGSQGVYVRDEFFPKEKTTTDEHG